MNRIFKYFTIMLIVLSACKSKRLANEFNISSSNITYKNNLEEAKNGIKPKDAYLFKSIKVKMSDEDKEYQFNSILKIVPDSGFIFSAIGPIGIELARIYVSEDNGYFINRMKKEVYEFKADSIYNIIGLPLSSEFIDDLFFNKIFMLTEQARPDKVEENRIIKYYNRSKKENKYDIELAFSWFDFKYNTFTKYYIQSKDKSWTADLNYKGFYKMDKYLIPKEFDLLIKINNREFKIDIEINKLPEITERELKFSIPERYERKKGLKF